MTASFHFLPTWRAEIEAELIEARQSQAAAIAKAAEAEAAAELGRKRHHTTAAELGSLPSDLNLSRALSGRLEASRLACEASDRQALFCRRAVDAAAERLRMLEDAMAQLDMVLAPKVAETEAEEGPKAPTLRLAS